MRHITRVSVLSVVTAMLVAAPHAAEAAVVVLGDYPDSCNGGSLLYPLTSLPDCVPLGMAGAQNYATPLYAPIIAVLAPALGTGLHQFYVEVDQWRALCSSRVYEWQSLVGVSGGVITGVTNVWSLVSIEDACCNW